MSLMAWPVCCSCSACCNFASLFHWLTLAARQVAVLMTSEPCFLCLTKSSEVEKSQMNQILLHQLITWLPNLSKTRGNMRIIGKRGFRRSNAFHITLFYPACLFIFQF
ncbi:hypothetical protein E2320_020881 [Naja naja]|nr:hypothetical protein E2320_020881 [Naja naja]